jgi:hypothetical protein
MRLLFALALLVLALLLVGFLLIVRPAWSASRSYATTRRGLTTAVETDRPPKVAN